jgi:hypothetical protein
MAPSFTARRGRWLAVVPGRWCRRAGGSSWIFLGSTASTTTLAHFLHGSWARAAVRVWVNGWTMISRPSGGVVDTISSSRAGIFLPRELVTPTRRLNGRYNAHIGRAAAEGSGWVSTAGQGPPEAQTVHALACRYKMMSLDSCFAVPTHLLCSGGLCFWQGSRLPLTFMPVVTGMLVGVCSWLIPPLSWV